MGRRLPLLATILAGVVLVVGTIGPPLFGRGTFLASDVLTSAYPWRAEVDGAAQNVPHHGPVGDTVDGVFPLRASFGEAVRDGEVMGWNPYPVGGTTLSSDGSAATLSPFEVVFVVFPSWFAPAALKLATMAVAIGFTFLFCRRLGVGRVPALFGGLVFAGSGFMVMWTNWPHPEVAALIPGAFWAVERFLTRPSVRTACPIALALAVMLLGNFPAVVFHTLYVLGPYVLVRVALLHGRAIRERVALVGGVGVAIGVGGLLVAAVLLPFAARLDFIGTESRHQAPSLNLGILSLVTTVAPKALGLSTVPDGGYFGVHNQVEAVSFVGVTAAILALIGVALPRRPATPRGAREVLLVATLVLGWATFVGGDVLELLQNLPGFAESFVGRSRAVLGFTVGALAALGLEAMAQRARPETRRQWAWAIGVVAFSGLAAAYALNRALWRARGVEQVDVLRQGLVLPAVVGALTLVAVVVLWRGRRPLAGVALAAVPLLLAVESLDLSLPLLPNEDVSTVYPLTPGLDFLEDEADGERVAGERITFYGTAPTLYGMRTVTGHSFASPTWRQMLLTVDPAVFNASPTFGFLSATPETMASPLLDRMATRWFAITPQSLAAGERRTTAAADPDACDRTVDLGDGEAATVRAPAGARGLVLRVCEPADLPTDAALDVEVDGATVPVRVPLVEEVAEGELPVTVPGDEATPAGTEADVSVTLRDGGPDGLVLAADETGGVLADVVVPADDGLRLVYADDIVVYERTRALPRVRWAGDARVVTDPAQRLEVLSAGEVPDETVVLSDDGPAGSAEGATVTVVSDEPDHLEIEVDAAGDGYVVVADALQQGWVAEVDGEPADLVAADHAAVAVHVPEGQHTIALREHPPGQRAGVAVSGGAVLLLVAAWAWGDRVLARRARPPATPGQEAPAARSIHVGADREPVPPHTSR